MARDFKLNRLTDEQGESISPILSSEVKNYMIDIDGTICDDIPNEEPTRMATANVYPDALETLNKWYEGGHVITSLLHAQRSSVK